MAYRAALFSFSKGELSPEVAARFDLPTYQAGLRRAQNVKIRRTGGVSKRMGTRFVMECPDDTARLFPFQFADEQAYALLFSQAAMQPLALGGAVLEEHLQVIAISNAAQAQITVHYHAYTVGQKVYLTGIEGMTEINDRWLTILSVPDQHNIVVDFNSTAAGAFTGSGGGTDRTGAPAPPPAPPTVPTPAPSPTPPTTTNPAEPRPRCVDWNELVLLANSDGAGGTKPLRACRVGDVLWTQHEISREWGAYPIEAISFAEREVFKAPNHPRATALHRFGVEDGWVRMQEIGEPDGTATVALVTVKGAHTYATVQPDGSFVLNHNLKPAPGDDGFD